MVSLKFCNMLFFILVTAMVCTISLCADDVRVTAEINTDSAYENNPLQGTILVTHNQNQLVDTKSFVLNQKPLSVEFIKNVQMQSGNPLIVSIYSFQMPAQPAGLYALPEIAVHVGGNSYRSIMSSYEVLSGSPPTTTPTSQQQSQSQAPAPSASASPSYSQTSTSGTSSTTSGTSSTLDSQPSVKLDAKDSTSGSPVLKLEAGIHGKTSIYPGQRTILYYRYFYRGNIGLKVEKLPLLDAIGLMKIGEKEINTRTIDGFGVTEITQEVQAVKPGTFSFGPSVIEGVVNPDSFEEGKQLTSEAAPVTLTVLPFPEEGKPVSFNGAVGDFQFKVSLVGEKQVNVGDEIALSLRISGKGNLTAVPVPEVCCQPGFTGFFRTNDLPPRETIEGDTKIAVVQLRPTSQDIKAIPSVEFSFFNPNTEQYTTLHSEPIPITVKAIATGMDAKVNQSEQPSAVSGQNSPAMSFKPALLEIKGIYKLDPSDLNNKVGGTWAAFAIIPFGIAMIFFQYYLKQVIAQNRARKKTLTSQDLIQAALEAKKGSSRYFNLIRQALMQGLVENGEIVSTDMSLDDIQSSGVASEVKTFLKEIDERRFSGKGHMDDQWVRERALALLDNMCQLKLHGSKKLENR